MYYIARQDDSTIAVIFEGYTYKDKLAYVVLQDFTVKKAKSVPYTVRMNRQGKTDRCVCLFCLFQTQNEKIYNFKC